MKDQTRGEWIEAFCHATDRKTASKLSDMVMLALKGARSLTYEDAAKIAESIGMAIDNGIIPPTSGSITNLVASALRQARRVNDAK